MTDPIGKTGRELACFQKFTLGSEAYSGYGGRPTVEANNCGREGAPSKGIGSSIQAPTPAFSGARPATQEGLGWFSHYLLAF